MSRFRIRHAIAGVATILPAGCVYVHYKYRPRGSFDREYHEQFGGADPTPTNVVERALLNIGSSITITLIGVLSRFVMHNIHQIDIVDDAKLHELIRSDRDGRPLVTYMNHGSMLDEPLIMACLVPYDIMRDRKRVRWGICTEEVCFSQAHHATLFGSIKAIPVQRGGSIHQKGIATLQRKVNSGDWVHIFPEGRIWQEDGTPQRDSEGRWCSDSGRCAPAWQKIGPFKWGIGKIIANAERVPIVLPMYSWGNNAVLPQGRDNNLLPEGPVLSSSKLVTVTVGDPVDVSDLLRDYHAAALRRALRRNELREERLAAAERTAAAGAAAAGTAAPRAGGGLLGQISSLFSGLFYTSSGAGPASVATASRPSALGAVSAGDRLAGLARQAGPEVVAAEAAAHRSERELPRQSAGDDASELAREISSAASSAMDGMTEAGGSVARGVARAAAELEGSLSDLARDAEARARELWLRLAEAERRLRGGKAPEGGPTGDSGDPKSAPAAGAGSPTPAAGPAAGPAPSPPPSAFHGSVSVPRPMGTPAAAVPAADPSALGPRRAAPHAPPTFAPESSSGAVALSEAPVVEVVPSRTLSNGVVVPTYVEAPLRAKPPDHAFLTLEEAQAEEDARLQLYSDIADRLQDALRPLEARVMARRRAQGWVEDRPMK